MTRILIGIVAMFMVVAGAGALRAPEAALAGGGGCHGPYTDSSGTRVDLEMNCFVPTVLHAEAGATIEFVSGDEWAHTVTGTAISWGDWEPVLFEQTITQTFEEPGVYVYFCALHPGMTGAIVVGDGSGAGPAAPRSAPTDDGPTSDEESQARETQTSGVFGSGSTAVAALGTVIGILVIGTAMRVRRRA